MARGSWKERAAESVTIVISVLVALVLGSGWEYLGDRVQEREYLDGLLAEFQTGRRELESDRVAREAILVGTRRILDWSDGGAPAPPADSVGPLVGATNDYRFFTPSHPVLEDIIAGGNLDILRSDDLRRALLSYMLERDRLAVAEQRERDFVADQLEPYLVARVRLRPVGRDGWVATDFDSLVRLARDPSLQSLLELRWTRSETARRFASSLARRIDRVIELLERETG